MPKKIRELKSLLLKAGLLTVLERVVILSGAIPLLPGEPITVAGQDGDDAKLYLEKEINQKIKKLEDLS
jgi:multidrug efflux pump subunit AcrA (membrane-fusion protein)